ncbi:MAG TPA: hypothetical protein VE196_08695, partial [Pseudonocardiaceae bacterium]|nr:hypothetical protein [Pseudonocardiaceae bacterium]
MNPSDSSNPSNPPTADPFGELRQDAADVASSLRSLFGMDSAMAELDPAGFGQALGKLAMSVASDPPALSRSVMEYGMRSAQAAMTATLRSMGLDQEGPVEPARDARFTDPAWTTNPLFYLMRQQHALLEGFLQDLLDGAELDEATRRKAEFAL